MASFLAITGSCGFETAPVAFGPELLFDWALFSATTGGRCGG